MLRRNAVPRSQEGVIHRLLCVAIVPEDPPGDRQAVRGIFFLRSSYSRFLPRQEQFHDPAVFHGIPPFGSLMINS